jgi:hypothetical protein
MAATGLDVVITTIAQVAVELYAMGMPTHGTNLSEQLLVIRFWDETHRTIEHTIFITQDPHIEDPSYLRVVLIRTTYHSDGE